MLSKEIYLYIIFNRISGNLVRLWERFYSFVYRQTMYDFVNDWSQEPFGLHHNQGVWSKRSNCLGGTWRVITQAKDCSMNEHLDENNCKCTSHAKTARRRRLRSKSGFYLTVMPNGQVLGVKDPANCYSKWGFVDFLLSTPLIIFDTTLASTSIETFNITQLIQYAVRTFSCKTSNNSNWNGHSSWDVISNHRIPVAYLQIVFFTQIVALPFASKPLHISLEILGPFWSSWVWYTLYSMDNSQYLRDV